MMNQLIYFLSRLMTRLSRLWESISSRWHAGRLAACGPAARIRQPRMIVGGRYIHIGAAFDAFPGLRLEAFDRHLDKRYTPKITIGDRVSVNYDCHIGCVSRITIGNDVLLASRVYISDHSHGAPDYHDIEVPPSEREVVSKGPVFIEDGVWIGEGACILPGVHIGRYAIVGANAVVTRNVPPYTIVGGVPARTIKSLSPNERIGISKSL